MFRGIKENYSVETNLFCQHGGSRGTHSDGAGLNAYRQFAEELVPESEIAQEAAAEEIVETAETVDFDAE